MAQYELNLKDYWFILRKKKILIIIIALVIGIFSFLFTYLNRPVPLYEASTQVRIERNTTFSGLMLQVIRWTSWNDMETNARIVKSFSLIERAAKKLGYIDPNMSTGDILSNEKVLKKIVRIQSSVSASQIETTNILEIFVTLEDPQEAQRLANTITDTFREENLKLNNKSVIEAKRLIEELVRKQNNTLIEAEEDLRTFRRGEGIFGLDQTTDYLTEEFIRAKKNLEDIKKQKKSVSWLIGQLNHKGLSVYEVFNSVFLIPDLERFQDHLQALFTEKEALLLDYTEEHPAVKKVERQILGLRSEILMLLKSKLKNLEKDEEFARQISYSSEGNAKSALDNEMKYNRLLREVNLNENIISFLKEKYQEALIRESAPIEEIYIVKPALLPRAPINPYNNVKPTLIGLIIGLIIGMVAAFLAESLDPTISTIEEVESYVGIKALGLIQYVTQDNIEKYLKRHGITVEDEKAMKHILYLITLYAPRYLTSEMYRTLRTTIQFSTKDKNVKSLLITSSVDGEGKTAVAVNLAYTLAQTGQKTLLVGGDFRRPKLHKVFGIPREPGLADVLLGNHKWEDVVRDAPDILMGSISIENALSSPGLDNLHIMTCGIASIQSVELLQSSHMDSLLDQLKRHYDYIIIDSTPIIPVSDAIVLASKVDGTIMVYRVGDVSQMLLKRAKLQMDSVKPNILGIIFNGLRQDALKEIYSSGYKIYQYYEDKKK